MTRIAVAGLWHLGSVTAACLALAGHQVIGLDDDARVIGNLAEGIPPISEPGLPELLREGLSAGNLSFTTDSKKALAAADVLWITHDTPVDERDNADVDFVLDRAKALVPFLKDGGLVIVSSQLPVGSTRSLSAHEVAAGRGGRITFACLPENLRLGSAIEVFTKPDRVVAGLERPEDRPRIEALFDADTTRFVFMSLESAEMTKHAINSFLAVSVTFANEIASVCEVVGADAAEVALGLKSERRIGPQAYVAPGVAFSGGTLARDIAFLGVLEQQHGLELSLFPAVLKSNDRHRSWPLHRLQALIGDISGRRIALLGLTYKAGTDTLRRSYALELARMLLDAGATVVAYDPSIAARPEDLELTIELVHSASVALSEADACVLTTEWPVFRELDWEALAKTMRRPIIVDPKGLLAANVKGIDGITYAVVGHLSRSGSERL